jgi:hypothetical protein
MVDLIYCLMIRGCPCSNMEFLMLKVSTYQTHDIADGIICYHFSIFVRNIVQGMMAYCLAKYFFFPSFGIHVTQYDYPLGTGVSFPSDMNLTTHLLTWPRCGALHSSPFHSSVPLHKNCIFTFQLAYTPTLVLCFLICEGLFASVISTQSDRSVGTAECSFNTFV